MAAAEQAKRRPGGAAAVGWQGALVRLPADRAWGSSQRQAPEQISPQRQAAEQVRPRGRPLNALALPPPALQQPVHQVPQGAEDVRGGVAGVIVRGPPLAPGLGGARGAFCGAAAAPEAGSEQQLLPAQLDGLPRRQCRSGGPAAAAAAPAPPGATTSHAGLVPLGGIDSLTFLLPRLRC